MTVDKITESHLRRAAYVYVRQSTQDQVNHNIESRRRQYNLRDKAQALGWREVYVIDEDLGKSDSGSAERKGFERLLSEVCQGKAGAVFAIEASRFARNGREWHTLLEMCGLLETLIIDHDGVYDPRQPNDRLLLGMKGTISEMELSILRQRSEEALRQKARRGELLTTVAVGFLRTVDDRIEKDPDRRMCEAISAVFRAFRERGSVRQVLMWYRGEQLTLPAVEYHDGKRTVVWKLPVYNTVLKFLQNPIYAGAYVFGRTYSRVRVEKGQKRIVRGNRRRRDEWPILIIDHHEAYIGWQEYERNQELIRQNANMKGIMVRGSARKGPALLAGLLRCGHCGRKLHVTYSGTKGTVVRYGCRGAMINHGTGACISIGAIRLERVVSEAALEVLSSFGIDAAEQALRERNRRRTERHRQKELELEEARYEAERAHRQYDLAEPENRLVTAELERRWNERLRAVRLVEEELAKAGTDEIPLNDEERRRLRDDGRNLHDVWWHPQADPQLKKRILRTIIEEIVISIEEQTTVRLVIHWAGGEHSCRRFAKNRTGGHRWASDEQTGALLGKLARIANDQETAIILNRLGHKTGRGYGWTAMRVASYRNDHAIDCFHPDELRTRGEMLINEAAEFPGVSRLTLYKLVRNKAVAADQVCKGAPWVFRREELEKHRLIGPCTADQQELFPG